MNIRTRAQDFELTTSIDSFVRERLYAALTRLGDGVAAVDVSMKDVNGPKGGVDKAVLIVLRMRSGRPITLETSDEDLYAAISRGAKRAKRAVRRSLRKSRRIERRRLRDLSALRPGEARA